MNKLDMAHEYALKLPPALTHDELKTAVSLSWQYADLMQAEADKREQAEAKERQEKVRALLNDKNTFLEREGQHFDDVANPCKTYTSQDDWQPDWSVAPDNATAWTMRPDGKCIWWSGIPVSDGTRFTDIVGGCHTVGYAPSFNYQGDWKQSLRKRPETKPIKEKPKQHKCNCAHWKGSSFFMGDTFTCNDCGGTVTI